MVLGCMFPHSPVAQFIRNTKVHRIPLHHQYCQIQVGKALMQIQPRLTCHCDSLAYIFKYPLLATEDFLFNGNQKNPISLVP